METRESEGPPPAEPRPWWRPLLGCAVTCLGGMLIMVGFAYWFPLIFVGMVLFALGGVVGGGRMSISS